jgi:cleavage and polyadenylation specificity factor subunit 2
MVLIRHVPTLSIILLTHATTAHVGAFAHFCKHVPLFTQIPIYATHPVLSLGRTLLQDVYSSYPLASSTIPKDALSESSYSYTNSATDDDLRLLLQPPTPKEIASYFSLINPLKYSQSHQPLPSPFSPPLNGLTITAYNAGHTLGGTIWHIQHGMESVVYAVDWNQIRENVFSGAAWLGMSGTSGAEVIEQLRKPTALICSAKGVRHTAPPGGRTRRDNILLDLIRTTISKGGTVLIPTDTSARVLELAYVLEHAWRQDAANSTGGVLKSARLYLASKNVGATMRYARSMLEWMDENVVKVFEAEAANTGANTGRRTDRDGKSTRSAQNNASLINQSSDVGNGPFDLKHVKLLERKSQVDRILANKTAKVILASDASLAWGFSRQVLQRIADDPLNLVILTERGDVDSASSSEIPRGLSTLLWNWYTERKDGVVRESVSNGLVLEIVYAGCRTLDFKDPHTEPVEGKELLIYQQYLTTQRQLQTTMTGSANVLENSADAIDDVSSSSSSSSDESDSEKQGKALNASATQASRNKMGAGKDITGVNLLLSQPGLYDYDVRGKKGREAVFPYPTKRRPKIDDFGELIKPEEYLRAEERDEVDGQDMRSEAKLAGLGQKRKWEDSELQNANGRRDSLGTGKRRKIKNNVRSNDPRSGKDGSNGYNEGTDESDESDTDAESSPVGPCKLVYKETAVQANIRIAHVDFAGLHDQRSLLMLIPLIQPRKLIVVGGTKSEISYMAEECRQKLRARLSSPDSGTSDDVFTPLIGETVSASMDTNAWTVKLSDALVRRLHWQEVKGLGIVTLMGCLTATTPDEQHKTDLSRRKRQKVMKEEESSSETCVADAKDTSQGLEQRLEFIPTLDVLPANSIAASRSVAQPLHVGDLRLAELRRIMQATGHAAEFRGEGTLLVDELVAVRKSATGQVEVEGGGLRLPDLLASDKEGSFDAVRKRIYEGLAIIAGG